MGDGGLGGRRQKFLRSHSLRFPDGDVPLREGLTVLQLEYDGLSQGTLGMNVTRELAVMVPHSDIPQGSARGRSSLRLDGDLAAILTTAHLMPGHELIEVPATGEREAGVYLLGHEVDAALILEGPRHLLMMLSMRRLDDAFEFALVVAIDETVIIETRGIRVEKLPSHVFMTLVNWGARSLRVRNPTVVFDHR